jgi:hypothetical protein
MTKSIIQDVPISEDSFNLTLIYVSLVISVIIVTAYFMYRVYKKMQSLNDDFIKINDKHDTLYKSISDKQSYIESVENSHPKLDGEYTSPEKTDGFENTSIPEEIFSDEDSTSPAEILEDA